MSPGFRVLSLTNTEEHSRIAAESESESESDSEQSPIDYNQ